MLILRGSPALSQFRLQKLLQDLAAAGLPARAISAEFVHIVEPACGEPVEPASAIAACCPSRCTYAFLLRLPLRDR